MTAKRPSLDVHSINLLWKMYQFHRKEHGGLTLFSLFTFIMMLLLAGMAVDLMRFETQRTRVQNTMDGAVLAAANLRQEATCDTLVRDFFEKNGFQRAAVNVNCDEQRIGADEDGNGGDLIGRSVSAHYDIDVNTYFMNLLGIPNLVGDAASGASEGVQAIEISLVLDISGSMRFGPVGDNRIQNLKGAVESFLQEILDVTCDSTGNNCVQSPDTESITVNIVPYAGHVNPGPELFSAMGGNRWHEWSSCMEVTDADFDDADLPNATGDQLPHFMRWTIDTTWMNWGWCPTDDAGILAVENDYNTLNTFVQNIKLHDGTATHVGMKYGLALLNPTSRDELATAGTVDSKYAGRPSNWEDNVLKIVVLMTDGNTTDNFRPTIPLANGSATAWDYSYINDYQAYSMVSDTTVPSATPVSSTGTDPADTGTTDPTLPVMSEELAALLDRYGSIGSDLLPQDASEVEQGYPSANTYNDGTNTHNASVNNGHITAMCDEAKAPSYDADGNLLRADRVTVYTIAFLAPTSAQNLMRECASTPSYFFNVQDLDVGDAFSAIATNINKLKLTQ